MLWRGIEQRKINLCEGVVPVFCKRKEEKKLNWSWWNCTC